MLANEDREGKREREEGEGEGVNENFLFKKCDIISNCSENQCRHRSAIFQTGTGPEIWTGSMSAKRPARTLKF